MSPEPMQAIPGKTPEFERSFAPRFLSRHVSVGLLLLVLMAEAGVGAFVMRDLFKIYVTVQNMSDGSVQGLRGIGDMQYQAQETRRCTLYALTTNDGNLQVEYADQSREADRLVTKGIAQYAAQARGDRQIAVGRRLASDWDTYLRVRDEVLGLILEGSTKEGVGLDLTSGVPVFERVRQDLEEIKRLYDEEASQQLAAVAQSSRRSMTRLIAVLGFALLFGSIAIWAIQRSKMRAAVQFAKLQMEFVASVSHGLRTPITAILTAGENVRDGLVRDKHSLFEQGSIITAQAGQLMDLVDQVLLFAASAKPSPAHPIQELQISEIIDHALESTRGLIQQAGFTLHTQIEPDLPPAIADLQLLSQCLQNLIVNAVKYGDRDRWIGVVARLDQSTREIQIDVEDRGCGINQADAAHIFEPFYRSPQVVAARIHGTGLGLSIAKRSAEAFGGRISVATKAGVGSVFTLHLPVEIMERAGALSVARIGSRA
jgi:signal transduction histidine kinase